MTIKKTLSVKRPTVQGAPVANAEDAAKVASAPADSADPAVATAAASAGAPAVATIADRFKLDMTDPSAKKAGPAGLGTKLAVAAGVVALIVAGILTFVLYQHFEFMQSA